MERIEREEKTVEIGAMPEMNDRSSLDLYYRYVCLNDLSMLYTQRWSKHSIILFFFYFSACRCTVKSACQKATTSSPRWLAYGSGQQCIDFEQVLPDRIPIAQTAVVSFFLFYPGSFYVLTRLVTLSSKQQNEKPPRLWNFMKREYLPSTDEYCVEVVGG